MLGHGVYSMTEAAQLTGLRPTRVREWFRSRPSRSRHGPAFTSDYSPVAGDIAISFFDLIDVYVAGQLRNYGVSMQKVRRVYKTLAADLKVKHPFCHEKLLTDGNTILTSGLDADGREELVEVLTRQKLFPQIIEPFLKLIDYHKVHLMAHRWRIAEQVVIDPGICFGKPIVEDVGIATGVLAAAYHANNSDAEAVAEWFNLRADQILAAVRFEGRLAA